MISLYAVWMGFLSHPSYVVGFSSLVSTLSYDKVTLRWPWCGLVTFVQEYLCGNYVERLEETDDAQRLPLTAEKGEDLTFVLVLWAHLSTYFRFTLI